MSLKPDAPITLHTASRATAADGYEGWTARRLAKAMRRPKNALRGGTYTGDPVKTARMSNLWTTLELVKEFVQREAYGAAHSHRRMKRPPRSTPQNLKSIEEIRQRALAHKKKDDFQRTGTDV